MSTKTCEDLRRELLLARIELVQVVLRWVVGASVLAWLASL